MLDVLVASTASGFSCGSRRAYSSRLASRFSKIASITTSALATPSPATSACQPRQRLARASRRSGITLLEELARALHGGRDVLLVAILQRHGQAARRAPARDVAAHDAGADDVHVLGGLAAGLAGGLQSILQEEHAHQVARGRRAQQLRHRARFGFVRALALAAVTLPQLDHGVRGRVVLGTRAPRDLRAHLAGQDRPHQPQSSAGDAASFGCERAAG